MKTRNGTTMLALLFAVLAFAQSASAFYDASLGRWINRDPLGDEAHLHMQTDPANAFWHPEFGMPVEEWEGANLYVFVGNKPLDFMDPFGLSSIHAQVGNAVVTGDVAALEGLLATGQLSTAQQVAVQAALNKYRSTAVQWIAKNCKGSIGREFPSQLYNKTLEQIRNGSDAISKKAWKLLNDKRFAK